MRSAHAGRDGKVFSWDNPPEGGHPGEEPNCRCWAEETNEKECETIYWEIQAARERFNALFIPINEEKRNLGVTNKIQEQLEKEIEEKNWEKASIAIPDRALDLIKKGSIVGLGVDVYRLRQINKEIEDLEQSRARNERLRMRQQEKLDRLLKEREKHENAWDEYARRYEKCKKREREQYDYVPPPSLKHN